MKKKIVSTPYSHNEISTGVWASLVGEGGEVLPLPKGSLRASGYNPEALAASLGVGYELDNEQAVFSAVKAAETYAGLDSLEEGVLRMEAARAALRCEVTLSSREIKEFFSLYPTFQPERWDEVPLAYLVALLRVRAKQYAVRPDVRDNPNNPGTPGLPVLMSEERYLAYETGTRNTLIRLAEKEFPTGRKGFSRAERKLVMEVENRGELPMSFSKPEVFRVLGGQIGTVKVAELA